MMTQLFLHDFNSTRAEAFRGVPGNQFSELFPRIEKACRAFNRIQLFPRTRKAFARVTPQKQWAEIGAYFATQLRKEIPRNGSATKSLYFNGSTFKTKHNKKEKPTKDFSLGSFHNYYGQQEAFFILKTFNELLAQQQKKRLRLVFLSHSTLLFHPKSLLSFNLCGSIFKGR